MKEELNDVQELKNVQKDYYLTSSEVYSISFNKSLMEIKGFANITKIPTTAQNSMKLSLVIRSEEEEYILPLKVGKNAKGIYGDYSGSINFGTITNGQPLSAGKYKVTILIEQLEEDGAKAKIISQETSLGKYNGEHIHSATMERFTAKRYISYNLIVEYNEASQSFDITSKKLIDIDPALYENGVVEGRFSRKIKEMFLLFAYHFYSLFARFNKGKNSKKILFLSDSRDDLSGNFEYIYEEMERQNLSKDYKITCKLYRSNFEPKSAGAMFSIGKEIATSKYILLDDFYPIIYRLKIREDQELVQVWHAVGAFKKFGYSRAGMEGGPSLKSKNHRNYTKVLVSSKSVAENYAEGFGVDIQTVMPMGAPRTDLFFDEVRMKTAADNLYEEYPVLKEKKVILFAPTFRGNGQRSAHYNFEFLNLKRIYEELSDEYVFVLKIHPFVKNKVAIPYEYSDFFIDLSEFREVNDLLIVTDILITDYSSLCFEFALLDRQMIFFAPDLTSYMISRSFYPNYLEFIPGTLAMNSNELIEQIKAENIDHVKLEKFVNYYFDEQDGKASKRFVDALIDDFSEFKEEEDYIK